MRVLVLSQFYRPEPCAASNRVAALVDRLAIEGHQVTVLTGFPCFPSGEIERRYRGRPYVVEPDGAIRVVRVWTYASRRQRGFDRLLNWFSVALGATAAVLDPRRGYDLIVVSTPPITMALPALVAKLFHRAALVADVRDVFPEIAIEMGEWKRDGRVARAVGFVADLLYRASRYVVSVTASARREIVARGVAAEKVLLAPNGFDAVAIEDAVRPYEPAPGEMTVMYIGNMGLAAGLDVVLDAAATLASDPRFVFVLIGDGADAGRLRERVDREGLHNVKMLGVLPRTAAMSALQEADVCVVPLRGNIKGSLPTKLFDALSVGCPVVVSAQGEAQRIVEESGGGIAVPPEDGKALADAVRTLADDRERRLACGRLGRSYVYRYYDRARVMADLTARLTTPVSVVMVPENERAV
jgi:glycosyltransferase involved in cell wall biosynthesis